jgi:hypothetical protein
MMPVVSHTSEVTFTHKEIEEILLAKAKELASKDGKPTNDGVEIRYVGTSRSSKEAITLQEVTACFVFGGRNKPRV